MNNLEPAPGSKKDKKRVCRGYGGHQGGTGGLGTRGQKARSGGGTRPGFEGGQTPLYRRLPKLKGIAGGMGAGLPKFVVVNLDDLEKHFEANAEVTLESIKDKVLHVSGRDNKLPLKVLGTGELTKPLVIKAAAFSESAKTKIAAAGGTAEELPGKNKWTKVAFKKMVAEMTANGVDYYKEQAKKKDARNKARAAKAAAK
jgi:large subunit ribosomal protein L15